ncbi:protocatechuate 3,4-dioxygenase subunit alpha [Roseobacter cerasinus]|uniref:Protocatechuate 3,4-dioxygenase subunit alpha n=1 Tax=Roseobacter cerasinus TaxID=2602289 RepID=A0A640VRY5_9RHOB|nr:protocatechuate 3,4-dioxygenase subunit alpha [Roseobacter cerasinus]GFE50190.1 protocatechuate 3,4-dioxygenase subunit alpha [Roseobacter cerasinus]
MSDDLHETASQTAGPYVHIGCMPNACGITGVFAEDLGAQMLQAETPGQRIAIEGVIFDGDGAPLTDAVVEIWQADEQGRYTTRSAAFSGWGRAAADAETGRWRFETIKPGAVPCPDGTVMVPHITVWIIARGINIGLHTRMYFPEDYDMQAHDPVLARVQPTGRLHTLIAEPGPDATYNFNIYLQGPKETVFFDV